MTASYTPNERRDQAKKITRTREAAAEAMRIGKIMAKSAHDEGIPETRIAAELGVDRATIRRWIGK